jgi:hydrogenase expression/formation protein HypD
MYPRCVTPEGNVNAQQQLWKVFTLTGGHWRGISWVPDGNIELRPEFAHVNARVRFGLDAVRDASHPAVATECICGDIMIGRATPHDCALFGKTCLPESPVGACMVSSEGTCKIWYQYGGRPDLAEARS